MNDTLPTFTTAAAEARYRVQQGLHLGASLKARVMAEGSDAVALVNATIKAQPAV